MRSLYLVNCTLYSVHCTVYIVRVHCTVYITHTVTNAYYSVEQLVRVSDVQCTYTVEQCMHAVVQYVRACVRRTMYIPRTLIYGVHYRQTIYKYAVHCPTDNIQTECTVLRMYIWRT